MLYYGNDITPCFWTVRRFDFFDVFRDLDKSGVYGVLCVVIVVKDLVRREKHDIFVTQIEIFEFAPVLRSLNHL